jgi:hypothetical protein
MKIPFPFFHNLCFILYRILSLQAKAYVVSILFFVDSNVGQEKYQ